METNKKHTENALKQALRRRQPGRLPSNFNYRMMEQIRLEAEKQQKRKERVMLCGMIAGILLLLGVGVYTLVFKLEFNFKEYLSGMDFLMLILPCWLSIAILQRWSCCCSDWITGFVRRSFIPEQSLGALCGEILSFSANNFLPLQNNLSLTHYEKFCL